MAFAFLAVSLALEVSAAELPNGRRFREIVEEQFPRGQFQIGATTSLGADMEDELVILDREFGYVTPENDFKQARIARPDGMDFSSPERWVKHARSASQVLRAHAPIGPQCSRWIKDDERTPEELRQALTEFATATFAWCNDIPEIKWLDVVNESVLHDGTYFGPRKGDSGWENPWTLIGEDSDVPLSPPSYIREAFEIANRCAPAKKLVYNHLSLTRPAWEKARETILYLNDRNLRVDGFGWQAHVDVGWEREPDSLKLLAEAIDWVHSRKMAFHVTEMNVFLPKGKPRTDDDWKAQAKTYRAIIQVLLEKSRNGEVTCNFWGLKDRHAESPLCSGKDGRLFDEAGRAKPAYYAIQELLERQTTGEK